MSYEKRLREIEEQLLREDELTEKRSVQLWKEVLQGNRDRPDYRPGNAGKADKAREYMARRELGLEQPKDLKDAYNQLVSSVRTALEVSCDRAIETPEAEDAVEKIFGGPERDYR